ncbi:efflux RND transporter periplasmic adaptor subunit [Dokdonella sp.]|uniref:efflux RND transporter periplasmic adaptor subunit n=1 Tax=Dokdonella sp. TaxID=2291710 RepID=UPI00352867A3
MDIRSSFANSVRVIGIRSILLVLALLLAACSKEPPAPQMQALPVKAMNVIQRPTAIYKELIGEVRGSQEVEIRARVGGILTGKHFQDGALVEKGQLLFTIDPREYRAAVATAEAQLASADAAAARAQLDVARYQPLVAENAISKQVYDNAVAAARQGEAEVAALKANLSAAKLGLEYASVTAPISGRIGAADIFEGGLVSAGSTLLATVSSDDPVWVYFSVSERDLLDFQRRTGQLELPDDSPSRRVQLTLADGNVYGREGLIDFTDRALDSRTATYRLRAEFPNPEHMLKPGMFARIRVTGETIPDALLVPERAVTQKLGSYFVTIVGADGKAVLRSVTPGPRQGSLWVISEGLKAGDKVVVEGAQKARPGTPLKVIEITEADLKSEKQPAASAPAGG